MASDRSRFTYDEAQRYSGVVIQQGKPILDAEFDEAQEILSEEIRHDALDFVGPCGTPDDGYKITPGTNEDFNVGPGTMYVGGLRVTLPAGVTYGNQKDWLQRDAAASGARKELIYLELQQHEVSAFEDRSLSDPALGGLETARRQRISQRILRTNTAAIRCADAWTAQINAWDTAGRVFDPNTKQLRSTATLQVALGTPDVTATACEPHAVSNGFLGAENQLIRVAIKDAGHLVWAYDNGSAIHRVDAPPSNSDAPPSSSLVLTNPPLDELRRPRAPQLAEIARAAGELPNGESFAEPFGTFIAVKSYDPDSRTLVLDRPLPTGYAAPLFVRIWEPEVPFTSGNAVDLPATGNKVTVTNPKNRIGDFWAFAVRPGEPGNVFPERYKKAPQPPEGPRTWVCGLAIVEWDASKNGTLREDCRERFDNLVELTKRRLDKTCCTVTISPEDLVGGSLQPIVDRALAAEHFKLCLLPGEYVLTAPLSITANHKDVTLEACGSGVTVTAAADSGFAGEGMLRLESSDGVTIRGIRFVIPVGQTKTAKVGVGIGLRLVHSRSTTIENCQFVFQVAPLDAALGVGILANGLTNGISVRDNIFVGASAGNANVEIVGVAAVPGFFAKRVSISPNFDVDFTSLYLPNLPANSIATVRDRFRVGSFTVQPADPGFFVDTLPIEREPGTGGDLTPRPGTTGRRRAVSSGSVTSDATEDASSPAERLGTSGTTLTIGPRFSIRTDPRDFDQVFNPITVGPIITPGEIVDFGNLGDLPFFPRQTVSTGGMLPARIPLAEIVGNQFALMHAAVIFCGDIGMFRFSENRVELSSNGVIAVTTRWIPAVSFLNQTRVINAFRALETGNTLTESKSLWNGVQASSELLATMFQPRNAHVASALMSVPLPAALEKDTSLITMVGDVDDSKWPAPIAEAAFWLFPPASAITLPGVDNVPNLTGAISARMQGAWGQPDPFAVLTDPIVAGLGLKPIEGVLRSTTLAFECNDNSIEARRSDTADTGTALFVLDAPGEPRTSALIGANRFSNKSRAVPTAVVAFVSRCEVSGNLILNESTFVSTPATQAVPIPMFWSLLLLPPAVVTKTFSFVGFVNPDELAIASTARIAGQFITEIFVNQVTAPLAAATGNVFKGWPLLPIRLLPDSVPDPMNRWTFMNTVGW